mmetsp:Transcript_57648/g.122622  ORF Transcript_57648/g.122622 Transcript_57648/m.122622 type:complete len:357 (-) Transcript_57648:144-1214(-)
MGGDTAWEESYEDPVRVLPHGCPTPLRIRGKPQVEEVSNDLCTVKLVMMHRPTHDAARDKSGEYPFSWHLGERKRLWEIRLQFKFHRQPQGKIFWGLELDRFVPVSGMTKQAQKALVSACQRIVGDCYHTNGDDPSVVQGERESPAFVMPLWAFDQFHVAEPGREPPLSGNLAGVGLSRSEDGVSKYINAVKTATASISTDLVYTFCFWGVSKFLDIIKWEVVGGLMPGVKLDFDKFCGGPPVYCTMYEVPKELEQAADKRHLPSRKNQFFRAAAWSTLKPPSVVPTMALPTAATTAPSDLPDLSALNLGSGPQTQPAPADALDLLGLETQPESATAPRAAPATGKVENVDLLGLF